MRNGEKRTHKKFGDERGQGKKILDHFMTNHKKCRKWPFGASEKMYLQSKFYFYFFLDSIVGFQP